MENKTLIIVDGLNYVYRAFYALPHFKNTKGINTGAIFGVINMLKDLPNKFNTEYIVIIFDTKSSNSFRKKISQNYKSTRKKMPELLQNQLKDIYDVLSTLGFKIIKIADFEADDIIGSLSINFAKQDCNVCILTSDKDMTQLVNNKITIFNSRTNKIVDSLSVEKKFGVKPEQIVDYISIVGDISDNIPGIKNIGPKTAVKLLKIYKTLKNIILNIDYINHKLKNIILKNLNNAVLSYKLAKIKCDLPIYYTLKDFQYIKPSKESLINLYCKYDFVLKNIHY